MANNSCSLLVSVFLSSYPFDLRAQPLLPYICKAHLSSLQTSATGTTMVLTPSQPPTHNSMASHDPLTGTTPSTASSSIVPSIPPSDNPRSLPTTHNHHIWYVTGPAGCGKTTAATYLASTWGVPYLEGDNVRFFPPFIPPRTPTNKRTQF